jgi:hypothetical protein
LVRHLSLIVLALALPGCDFIGAGFMEPVDKIEAAFPVPQDVQDMQLKLFAQLEQEPAGPAALRRDYEQRVHARALSCSSVAPPRRFASVADLRADAGIASCVAAQDAALHDWLGLQRLRLAMQQVALVPLAPLPGQVTIAPQPEPVAQVIAARSANVAALQGTQGRFATIALPSGKTLHSGVAPGAQQRPASLSPNGRVLALPDGAGLRMVDAASGDALWSTPRHGAVAAWLPEIEATLLSDQASGLVLLDHRSGALLPYPLQLPPPLSWSIAVPAGKGRQVIGNGTHVFVVDHARKADGGLVATLVRQRELPGRDAIALPPLLMANGRKLVYPSGTDLAWLNLETGASGTWNLSAINGRGFSKNSESTVYLDAGPDGSASPRLFDIDRATLAHVRGDGHADGTLSPLQGRDGWVRAGRTLTLGRDAVANGEPEPLGRVIAAAHEAGQVTQ